MVRRIRQELYITCRCRCRGQCRKTVSLRRTTTSRSRDRGRFPARAPTEATHAKGSSIFGSHHDDGSCRCSPSKRTAFAGTYADDVVVVVVVVVRDPSAVPL